MAWPSATDFLEAVQDLRGSVDDEELRGGEVARTPLGLPVLWSGNFADVFKIHCPATGNAWALKCFTRQVPGLQTRYRRIAAHLGQAQLPFTVDFQYLAEGIRIGQGRFPALKMRWVEGLTLNQFVEEHLQRPGNLKMLLDLWLRLSARLRQSGIAHADLQHGNVLLVPQDHGALALRLIDYDGMYVPALADSPSGELGHPAYQHPQRLREGTYNADVDRFSHLAIYTAIRCLMTGRGQLWQRFNNGDNLLFREADFKQPATSDLFGALWELRDADLRALAGRLILACGRPLDQTPLLDEILVNGKVLPLSWKEESRVAETLALGKAAAAPVPPLPPGEGRGEGGAAVSVAALPPLPPERTAPVTTTPDTRPATTERTNVGWASARRQSRRFRAFGRRLRGRLAAAAHFFDALLRRLVGEENDLLRYSLWAALPLLLLAAVWAGTWALTPSRAPWKLRPIPIAPTKPRDMEIAAPTKPPDKEIAAPTKTPDKEIAAPTKPRDMEIAAPTKTPDKEIAAPIKTPNKEIAAPTKPPDKEIAVDLGSGVKLEMVLIHSGEFLMGSPDSDWGARDDDEKPQHRVRITKSFYLGKYLVTQEQWEAAMGSNPWEGPTGGNPSHFKGRKNPVEQVSWKDCQKFVEEISAKMGGGKFSLPTEAQWEYACRAGSTARYCFGDEELRLGEYAWFRENSDLKSHPVGEKKPNAWGLYDMHGNVYEWCKDWYDGYYAGSPTNDPTGPSEGSCHVFRGGSWDNGARGCWSACRQGFIDESQPRLLAILGFRVARVLAESPTTTLRLRPIEEQTVEVGKSLTLAAPVDKADAWKGKLQYRLAGQWPPGARIDPLSGEFSWTPPSDQAAGKHDVTVSVEAPGGRKDQTTFTITVMPPLPWGEREIAVEVAPGVKLEMVLIPAGEFLMGSPSSDKDAIGVEKPQHRVRIAKPFYLGKYLVTQEQWKAVMGNNPSLCTGPKIPVAQVGWENCLGFVEKLSTKTGGGKFTLPTEAQWEYACRAGSTTRYCFGDDESGLDEYAWYGKNLGRRPRVSAPPQRAGGKRPNASIQQDGYKARGSGSSCPVGKKQSNAWGLYDMHGNVWEWCQDWYDGDYYANSPTDDPTGPDTGSHRVARGGSSTSPAGACRSAYRNRYAPEIRNDHLGFRVARVSADK